MNEMSTEMEYKFDEKASSTGRFVDENVKKHYSINGEEVTKEIYFIHCGVDTVVSVKSCYDCSFYHSDTDEGSTCSHPIGGDKFESKDLTEAWCTKTKPIGCPLLFDGVIAIMSNE